MAQKYHINKHGVPAPCHAKKGNCPLGGDEQHFNSQEEAQEYADKINEQEYGLMSKVTTLKEEGKHLTSLIEKRKNKVPEPDLPDGKDTIRSIDDLDTLFEVREEYITSQEHDPVSNVQGMFDHVASKSGKLYRYEEENNYLETYPYNFYKTMEQHKNFLSNDEDYWGEPMEWSGREPEEAFNDDFKKHEKLHDYTMDLAVEYGKDYENKVWNNDDYNMEEKEELKEVYKEALADKVGAYVQNYGEE